MANKKFLFVLCVLVVLLFAGCVTWSAVGGTGDPHGLFTLSPKAGAGAEPIASYSVILGLFDSGYDVYVSAVKKADGEGKVISSVTKNYLGIFIKTTAYAAKK